MKKWIFRSGFALLVVWFLFLFCSRPSYKYNMAICAMFKNEAPWLKEWIVFHHEILGFEYFYLYNNDSSDNYKEVLAPFIDRGIVELIEWDSSDDTHRVGDEDGGLWCPFQRGAYNDCLKQRALGKAKWVAAIDVDEFITPVNGSRSLKTLLRVSEKQKKGSIKFTWRIFGTSDVWDLAEGELLTEKLNRRAPDDFSENRGFKHMYRPEAVILCNVHEAQVKKEYRHRHAKIEEFRLNHYWTRTGKVALEKRKLKQPEHRQLLEQLNSIEDRTMDQYLPLLRSCLNPEVRRF